MKLSDIIPDSQSLITRDYWERRNQLGVPGPEFKPEYANNPDYYPRDLNGYQTGTAQYDSQRGSHLQRTARSECSQSQQANGSPDQTPRLTRRTTTRTRIQLRARTTIRIAIPDASTISQQNQYWPDPGIELPSGDQLPERPTLHKPRAADRWPMRSRRRLETCPGRL